MVKMQSPTQTLMDIIYIKSEEDPGLMEWWVEEGEGAAPGAAPKEEPPEQWEPADHLFSDLLDLNTPIILDDFQTWMEEPMEVPSVEYHHQQQQEEAAAAHHPATAGELGQKGYLELAPPDDLMREFEAVLSSTLTPPHSPPLSTTSETQQQNSIFSILQELVPNELDQLVASRVEDLTSSGGESGSSCGGCSPRGDPDWSPSGGESGEEEAEGRRGRRGGRKRAGGPEERRQRKKEQNRDAATRYRLKKKKEVEGILGEERKLQEKNKELKHRVGDLTKEVSLLKSLMREVYKKKGLLK